MSVFGRRLAASLIALVLAGACHATAQERPLEARLQIAFDKGQLSGLHSFLLIHDGEILAERHFAGIDRRWGGTWSTRKNGAGTLHGLRSVTKSIIGLLYGIALAEGKVPDIDKNLIMQFPEYADLARDPKRKAILVDHALSMRMGTEWNEELSYLDPKNSARAMEYTKDPVRFALDRPIVREPGKQTTYNSGAVAVIAKLIERGSGLPIDKYAALRLFNPLGIEAFEWARRADGTVVAYSGLRLNIHDLAKVGELVIQNGKFRGRQILPAQWIAASTRPRSVHKNGTNYGYLWWLIPERWRGLPELIAGLGNGGQVLAIHPKRKFIAVMFAGNYNDADYGKLPLKVMTEFVVPAIMNKPEK